MDAEIPANPVSLSGAVGPNPGHRPKYQRGPNNDFWSLNAVSDRFEDHWTQDTASSGPYLSRSVHWIDQQLEERSIGINKSGIVLRFERESSQAHRVRHNLNPAIGAPKRSAVPIAPRPTPLIPVGSFSRIDWVGVVASSVGEISSTSSPFPTAV